MSINLAIQFSNPGVGIIGHRVRYARVDNTATPVYQTVVPDPITSPAVIAYNIDNGQYNVIAKPIYSDGRDCPETSELTAPCNPLISLNAYLSGSNLVVQYLAPGNAPKVRITVNYPNGGSYVANYVNTGSDITISLPDGVYGDYQVFGQAVCDESTGFFSAVSSSVSVPRNAPDTFIEISNVGSSPTRTQVFEVGAVVTPGVMYYLEVYSHQVGITAVAGDTPQTIAVKMANAINATSEISWNSAGSAPASGTPGFKPVATANASQVSIVLNFANQFAGGVFL